MRQLDLFIHLYLLISITRKFQTTSKIVSLIKVELFLALSTLVHVTFILAQALEPAEFQYHQQNYAGAADSLVWLQS